MNRNCSFIKRLFSSQKSIKAELNFKEGNICPNPFDIIDKNIVGIENRLRLYELRRLKEQLDLDASELSAIRTENLAICEKYTDKRVEYCLRSKISSEFPGTIQATDQSMNPSVTLLASPKSLNLSCKHLEKFCKIFKLQEDSEFEITVSNFPFVSQNKKRVQELLSLAIESIDSDSSGILDESDVHLSISNSANKKEPEFPIHWIQKNIA